jgi:glycosyltransferase involved in cell wall biosynthesis
MPVWRCFCDPDLLGKLGFCPNSKSLFRARIYKGMLIREFTNPLPALLKTKKIDERNNSRKNIRKSQRAPARMISVIIPAHNEQQYLPQTLEALKEQNYGWFEIIVVANGCTDRTADVARGLCHRLIVLSQKSLGVARNLGARMAKGELLLFLDADTILEPSALRTIAEEFSKECAAGTLKGVPDCERFKYRMIYAVKNFVHRSGIHRGSSGVILCWRKHFIRTGGFDEALEVRENSELIRRLRRFGAYRYIDEVAATTSMRRYDRRGCGRMIWLWLKLWVQSLFGDLHHRSYETVR